MIDMQLFHDVILVLAVLIGMTAALSVVMMIAPSVSRPARLRGAGCGVTCRGSRSPKPTTSTSTRRQPGAVDVRELVLR